MYNKLFELKGEDISRNYEKLDAAVRAESDMSLKDLCGYEDQEDLDNAGFWVEYVDGATVIWFEEA